MTTKLRSWTLCFCFFLAALMVIPALPAYASSPTVSTATTELVGWWGGHWGHGWGHGWGGWGYGHYWSGPHYYYYGPHYYYWRTW